MIDRFLFHAFATGVAGRIVSPFDEIIPAQASLALPERGGFATVHVEKFNFHDILRFESARAVVSGAHYEGSHDSLAMVIIEGFDLLGVVTADRIVARISSEHPDNPNQAACITPAGSHFENLRVGGCKLEVDLATDLFTKFGTCDAVRKAYQDDTGGFRETFNKLGITAQNVGNAVAADPRLPALFRPAQQTANNAIPESSGVISCTLAREIAGLNSNVTRCGHALVIKGFGLIRLAELKITGTTRRLSMLQFELGSSPSGSGCGGGAEGNGSGW